MKLQSRSYWKLLICSSVHIVHVYLETLFHNVPHLLCSIVAGVFYLDVAPLIGNRLSRVWPTCISPSRIVPPFFDPFYLILEKLFFRVKVVLARHIGGLDVMGEDGGRDSGHNLLQLLCQLVGLTEYILLKTL